MQRVDNREASASTSAKAATVTDLELGATLGLVLSVLVAIVSSYIAGFGIGGSIFGLLTWPWLWVIQGGLIGLLLGRSSSFTDGAAVGAISKAVMTSSPSLANEEAVLKRLIKSLFRMCIGGLIGLIVTMLSWEVSKGFWAYDFFWPGYVKIIWVSCGVINGTLIEVLCRNRSDRRENAFYMNASE
jgi:hypothetical protein